MYGISFPDPKQLKEWQKFQVRREGVIDEGRSGNRMMKRGHYRKRRKSVIIVSLVSIRNYSSSIHSHLVQPSGNEGDIEIFK